MTRKFSARYTADDELTHLLKTMKTARKAAGLSQAEFGKLIGVSRETVVHIEGMVECSVLSLECEVLKRWYRVCAARIAQHDCIRLQNAIHNYLFSSAVDTAFQIPATTAKIDATAQDNNEQNHKAQKAARYSVLA